ncbi:hypothetical protein DJ030_02735 [bacterium endosymbiont of Escarpia laminata]|nr:MAG: hypothetical protein DJ030_02735 [bacterium endosymbiont of Escarpia laminata]
MNGNGHVWSLENGEEYAQTTQAALAFYGLDNTATVLHAPLVGDRGFQWDTLSDLSIPAIDMLVIDGPPGSIQKHSRYPALPLLMERLNSRCTVYLDDAARADERPVLRIKTFMVFSEPDGGPAFPVFINQSSQIITKWCMNNRGSHLTAPLNSG